MSRAKQLHPDSPLPAVDRLLAFGRTLLPSPLQQLNSPFLKSTGIRLFIKRDDLIHPRFGGNKWRKLKYNLLDAAKKHLPDNRQQPTILTFGGAWSNHIYATAAACRYFGFNSIGLIRGEAHDPLNACLSFARRQGMQLHYIDRSHYRQKHQPHFIEEIRHRFGNHIHIIPEGGSTPRAIDGVREIIPEIETDIDSSFDIVCCASGTGATLAGLASALSDNQQAIGFAVLKGGAFLSAEVKKYLHNDRKNWHIEEDFHFGGYARISNELRDFINTFHQTYGIMLDAVYTAKMFYGLFDKIAAGDFARGTTIVAIHTGGLQGNAGYKLPTTQ